MIVGSCAVIGNDFLCTIFLDANLLQKIQYNITTSILTLLQPINITQLSSILLAFSSPYVFSSMQFCHMYMLTHTFLLYAFSQLLWLSIYDSICKYYKNNS